MKQKVLVYSFIGDDRYPYSENAKRKKKFKKSFESAITPMFCQNCCCEDEDDVINASLSPITLRRENSGTSMFILNKKISPQNIL